MLRRTGLFAFIFGIRTFNTVATSIFLTNPRFVANFLNIEILLLIFTSFYMLDSSASKKLYMSYI